MDDNELKLRLNHILNFLKEGDRDLADAELYSLFDDLEFISDDYEEEDDEEFEEDFED